MTVARTSKKICAAAFLTASALGACGGTGELSEQVETKTGALTGPSPCVAGKRQMLIVWSARPSFSCYEPAVAGLIPIAQRDRSTNWTDRVIWYSPKSYSSGVWNSDAYGSFTLSQMSTPQNRAPLVGDFDSNGYEDIWWFKGGASSISLFQSDGFSQAKAVTVGHMAHPVVSAGGRGDDLMLYSPGDPREVFNWNPGLTNPGISSKAVSGTYIPFMGDFDHNGFDDVLWYGGASSSIWWANAQRLGDFDQVSYAMPDKCLPVVFQSDADFTADVLFWCGSQKSDGYGNYIQPVWKGSSDRQFVKASMFIPKAYVNGEYFPFAASLDNDGLDDIVLYTQDKGGLGQACNADGTCNGLLTCQSSVCRYPVPPCGGADQVCCGKSSTCNASLSCQSEYCKACGGVGQPCCGTACSSGAICSSGQCAACGGPGEPCCGNDVCKDDFQYVCISGKCGDCGEGNEPCCAGNICHNGLDFVCTSGKCTSCGRAGQICCGGSKCDSGFTCSSGKCYECGGSGEPCCNGTSCDSGYSCMSGTCRIQSTTPTCSTTGVIRCGLSMCRAGEYASYYTAAQYDASGDSCTGWGTGNNASYCAPACASSLTTCDYMCPSGYTETDTSYSSSCTRSSSGGADNARTCAKQ